MGLVRQYQELHPVTADDWATAQQWTRHRTHAAEQIQQVVFDFFGENGCGIAWSNIMTMDLRFVGDLTVDHLRQRAIVVMHSASGDPVCSVTGAEVFDLAAWDSPTPANFGGDGHGWWRVCYIVPDSGDSVNFSGVTGSLRYATWFTASDDLLYGLGGNFGDGVAIVFTDGMEYTNTLGSAHAEVSVSQAALPRDALFLWFYNVYRSIDDITQEKHFHGADGNFNHDHTLVNADFVPVEPSGGQMSSIDWAIDDRDPWDTAMTYTMGTEVDAVASVFLGSCRVLATAFSADLRAICLDDDTLNFDATPFNIPGVGGGGPASRDLGVEVGWALGDIVLELTSVDASPDTFLSWTNHGAYGGGSVTMTAQAGQLYQTFGIDPNGDSRPIEVHLRHRTNAGLIEGYVGVRANMAGSIQWVTGGVPPGSAIDDGVIYITP